MIGVFEHPRAAERATCPRVDGHYVPNRCRVVYLALRAAGGFATYDRLVVDRLQHTRHERKLRELREINREYDAAGRAIWDLVLTRRGRGGSAPAEFMLNPAPRQVAGQQVLQFYQRDTRTGEADIITILLGG